jgi:hypothetical protein
MRSVDALRLLAVLVCAVAACGGDDDGNSGVDPEKTLDQVTIEEAMDLCEWSVDQVQDDFVRFSCFVEAIADSQGDPDADCEALAEECIDDPPGEDAVECEVDPDTFEDSLPDCASEITVADLEDCYAALIDTIEDAAGDISCDSVPVIDAFPDACVDIDDRCPDLFD